MSTRKKWITWNNIIPIILASVGLGMIAVILLPVWLWVVFFGAGLIIYAWYLITGR